MGDSKKSAMSHYEVSNVSARFAWAEAEEVCDVDELVEGAIRSVHDNPQPDSDVMGYLCSRYGVEPRPYLGDSRRMPDEYVVTLPCITLIFQACNGAWWPIVEGGEPIGGYDTLADACDAADDAARDLLDETREVLG